jgi:hypothetical protein
MSQAGDAGGQAVVKKTIVEILNQRQFSHLSSEDTSTSVDPFGQILRGILEFPPIRQIGSFLEKLLKPLEGFFSFVAARLGEGDIFWYFVTGLFVLLFISLILKIWHILSKSMVYQESERLQKPACIPFDDLRKKTSASVNSLDYKAAIQNMYLLMLHILDKRTTVSLSLTNREIEERLGMIAQNEAIDAFHCCTVIFEDTVYAGRTADQALFSDFSSHYEVFKRTF